MNLHKLACFLLFLVIICTSISLPAAADKPTSKVVRVGWHETIYDNISTNGRRSGYVYEYEQAVAAYTGWTYEYVEGSWEGLLEMLAKGEIDLLGAVSYTDERGQKMLFSEMPMGQEKYYLYARLADTGISAADYTTLNGKHIGMLEGSVQIPQFEQWKAKRNIHTENLYINGIDELNAKLARKEFDGFISTETPFWTKAGMSIIASTGSSGIYFAVNKKRPDLKNELDKAMSQMEYDKPFYVDELYKRYYSSASSATLFPDEQAWLAQHGAIRIGYLEHDRGFSEVDSKSGKLVGVINDYIKFAKDCLGKQALDFELVGFASQSEELQALKDNKIDMIFHFSKMPFIAEENDLILSNTVLTMPLAVLTNQDYFDEDAANTVAIEKGNQLLQWHIYDNYPQWRFVEYASADEAEKAVVDGKADCFISRPGQLKKYSDDERVHSVLLTKAAGSAFAVRRDNTVLLSILNKTLKPMPTTMLTSAFSMYNSAAKKMTALDFVRENKLLVTLLVLVLLLILEILRRAKLAEAKATQNAEQFLELNKRLEDSHDRLQAALEEAKQANAAKTNFLFNMSHDIRTPMNALLGYTRLLREGLREPKLLEYQEKMEQAGNLLLSILNNVLDMARIESGKAELDENYGRIDEMLEELCNVFAIEAEKKQLQLVHELQVEHEHILCDATKVKEVFSNLISNAIKYTPAGGKITLRVQELPCDREGYVRIQTEVRDTGIGMSKEYLPMLFDTFSRERNTTIGKVAGTGLGMSIVKKLVDMMGGTIEVASELGKGSCFTVTLQHKLADEAYYKQPEKVAAPEVKRELLQGKRILLAEDNDLNAEIATIILGRLGLEIVRVADGVQCVERITQHEAGTYDAILMDIQMPNMDGYKATQTIRNLADKKKAVIPIIAMTANAFEEDRQAAYKAGMDGHIAKPIDVDKVGKILSSLLNK